MKTFLHQGKIGVVIEAISMLVCSCICHRTMRYTKNSCRNVLAFKPLLECFRKIGLLFECLVDFYRKLEYQVVSSGLLSEIERPEQKEGARRRKKEDVTSEAGGRPGECRDVAPDKENTARGQPWSTSSWLLEMVSKRQQEYLALRSH